jgi:hypothetical protein
MKSTKWVFGYNGASETYWLMADSLIDLCRQIDERGMATPDWWEDTGHGP